MSPLKEFRLKKGITQHQLAKEIGVSDCFVSLIEAGKKKPGVETAKKIGAILGCEWFNLFEDLPF